MQSRLQVSCETCLTAAQRGTLCGQQRVMCKYRVRACINVCVIMTRSLCPCFVENINEQRDDEWCTKCHFHFGTLNSLRVRSRPTATAVRPTVRHSTEQPPSSSSLHASCILIYSNRMHWKYAGFIQHAHINLLGRSQMEFFCSKHDNRFKHQKLKTHLIIRNT